MTQFGRTGPLEVGQDQVVLSEEGILEISHDLGTGATPWVSEAQMCCLDQMSKLLPPLYQHLPANPPSRTCNLRRVPHAPPALGPFWDFTTCHFQINHLSTLWVTYWLCDPALWA